MWQLNPACLVSAPLPRDSDYISAIVISDDLVRILEEKRRLVRKDILGAEVALLKSGFVDTSREAVLTSNEAISAIRAKACAENEKCIRDIEREIQRSMRNSAREARHRDERERIWKLVNERRAVLASITVCEYTQNLRSSTERRSVARMRALRKLHVAFQQHRDQMHNTAQHTHMSNQARRYLLRSASQKLRRGILARCALWRRAVSHPGKRFCVLHMAFF